VGRMDDEDGWPDVRLISTQTNFTPQISCLKRGSTVPVRDDFRELHIVKLTFSETLVLLIQVWKHGKGKDKTYFDRID